MTGLSLSDANRLALAQAGVGEGPDGSLRSSGGAIVSPGVAAALISRGDSLGKAQAQPVTSGISPDQFHRGYITAGHASDSPANGPRGVIPEPPEGGGRSASLCTTPDPDDGGPGEGDGVEKVVEPEHIHRSYLQAGHAAPSPDDAGDNNPAAPVTGSGHAMHEHAVSDYSGNVARAATSHVSPSQACEARPATAQWSPRPGMRANAVPQPVNPGHLTGHAPGERG